VAREPVRQGNSSSLISSAARLRGDRCRRSTRSSSANATPRWLVPGDTIFHLLTVIFQTPAYNFVAVCAGIGIDRCRGGGCWEFLTGPRSGPRGWSSSPRPWARGKVLGKVRSLYEKKAREYRAEVNLDPAHGHGSVEQKPRRALDEEDLLCPPDRIFENRRRTLGSLRAVFLVTIAASPGREVVNH
jgi:hypothetical protein